MGCSPGRRAGVLTEEGTFLVDHVISNAGVVCMIAGSVLLRRCGPGTSGARLMWVGTGAETIGALLDAYSHLRGGESPLAFGFIGVGFLLALCGVVVAWRRRRLPGPGARD